MAAEIHLNLSPGDLPEEMPDQTKRFLMNLTLEVDRSLDMLQKHVIESIGHYYHEQIEKLPTPLSSREGIAIMGEVSKFESIVETIKHDVEQIKKDIANIYVILSDLDRFLREQQHGDLKN
ncbi:MAG: hypothetical protein N0C81_14765 [Candidatus Thiodiazotropha lotti]|nr:hypothetical protein [Candidatus Thiodiazotropha lotti]MCG7932220.1 hypothetical protein [Candidatus Thiodiazotropha lotti]MCG8004552.1 hypothetical protein [Candidatus Thiodiazotropha lotti]MCG8008892.1 hypothetical protein [Candidatus Thiodiazotropha lotti]MCW4188178.1 hypothetical protein [Candidatus Thiodiazotropha lotti]